MKMAKQWAMLVLVAFTWTAPVAEARSTTLIDHESVVVSGARSAADVKRAILIAGTKKGWKAIKETADNVRLEYNARGKHLVVIDVRYNAKSFGVKYAGSENMNYEERDGTRVIHPKYNKWVSDLIQSINLELIRAS
jgi:hypothetical protein